MKNLSKLIFPLVLSSVFSLNSYGQNDSKEEIKIPKKIYKLYHENRELLSKKFFYDEEISVKFSYDLDGDNVADISEIYNVSFDNKGMLGLEKDSVGNIVPPWAYILLKKDSDNSLVFFDLARDGLNGNEIFGKVSRPSGSNLNSKVLL